MRSYFLFFLLIVTSIYAKTDSKNCSVRQTPSPRQTPCLDSRTPRSYIDAKAGYFFFLSPTMRKVYDKGGIDVQLSGAYPLWLYLNIYGSVEYLARSGHSLNFHQRTSIWALPLSLGAQFNVSIHPRIRYYLTIGPRYIFAFTHNHSKFVPRHMHSNGIGGFANMGFLFDLYHGFMLDVFGEYSYCRLSFHSSHPGTKGRTAQVGGLTFGAGLGYMF